MGELRQFIQVWHSAIAGRTGCSQLLQYDDSTCRNTAFRVFKAQLGLSLSNGPFARPWRSSGWETYSMYCKPLTVARHARAVHCNAMQFCEHTRTRRAGRDLETWSDEGALTWSIGLRFWALHGPPMASGRLVRPCCDPATRVAQCLAWHGMANAADFLSHETKLHFYHCQWASDSVLCIARNVLFLAQSISHPSSSFFLLLPPLPSFPISPNLKDGRCLDTVNLTLCGAQTPNPL